MLLHPFSESMASGVRTLELAKSLKKIGFEPIVFSPYERTRINRDGISIVNVPTLFSSFKIENTLYHLSRRVYYNRSLQKFVINLSKKLTSGKIQISSNLSKLFREFDLDVIQAEQDNAALFLLPIGSKLDLPIVLDLHGIWPEELLAANAIKVNSKEWNDLQCLINHIVKNVHLTVVLSDAMKEYVISHYDVKPSKVTVIPPGGRIVLNEYYERPMPPRVVYAGTVSHRKHVDLFVKSMPYIKRWRPDTEFYITNKGDLLIPIKKMAESLKIHPTYFWFTSFERTLKFLSSCHVGVLPSTLDTSARISMPSKLFDYLSVGLPVVANDVGGWTDIIKNNRVGIVTQDDPSDFAKGVFGLLDSPNEMFECGSRGIELIKKTYNWDVSATLLAKNYDKLI